MERLDIRVRIGLRIKHLRAVHDLTQDTLAYTIDLSRSYLAEVETGKRNVSMINLERIADGLGESLAAFFNDPLFGEEKTPVQLMTGTKPAPRQN